MIWLALIGFLVPHLGGTNLTTQSPTDLAQPEPHTRLESPNDWILIGSVSALALGGVASYLWLREEDAIRTSALQTAQASQDPAMWRDQRARFDEANNNAVRASTTMYVLLGIGVGIGIWSLYALATEEDERTFTHPGVKK